LCWPVGGTRFPDKALYTLLKRREAPDEWAAENDSETPTRQLTSFQASRTLLRNEGVALLKGLASSLHTLNLSFNPSISDWSFLGCLTSLTHLDISLNVGFTDEVRTHSRIVASRALVVLSR
jgi:hypothetical protein